MPDTTCPLTQRHVHNRHLQQQCCESAKFHI